MSTPLRLDPGHAALTHWRDVIDGASITLSATSADAIAPPRRSSTTSSRRAP